MSPLPGLDTLQITLEGRTEEAGLRALLLQEAHGALVAMEDRQVDGLAVEDVLRVDVGALAPQRLASAEAFREGFRAPGTAPVRSATPSP